jgi:hypothetical protein
MKPIPSLVVVVLASIMAAVGFTARMKKLQVGQTINAIYTEVMKIKTSR